ncbi:peptidase domain-containing ABC transporter [Calothrix sp. PCC 6303]|uniref:peptidase domain-containing ABC transporter n=1 Tax=Calothrix sp. PCC 6303 TaxID=1170562 RepID=UPI0002A01528|nr:type I secretion system permease/ATPase [Calothrix sp. PCC 6303]AFY99405.1 cyclic nucleotide-regulated ABC bacteriocin/lantibiotic exporter [Calothrix sp. PCC 6303]
MSFNLVTTNITSGQVSSVKINITELLGGIFPFKCLPVHVLKRLEKKTKIWRYRMGQMIVTKEVMPLHISIIYQGQVRLIGYNKFTEKPITLTLLQPGEVIGWISHLRGEACETAIASTEVVCLNLPIADFLDLLTRESDFAQLLRVTPALSEVYDLLTQEFADRAIATLDEANNLAKLALDAVAKAVIYYPSQTVSRSQLDNQLDSNFLWLVSSSTENELPVGMRLDGDILKEKQKHNQKQKLYLTPNLRLLGVPKYLLPEYLLPEDSQPNLKAQSETVITSDLLDIPDAPDISDLAINQPQKQKFPCVKAKGESESVMACLQMLSHYYHLPFRKDMLRQIISKQIQQTGKISLQFCGAVAELMGLTTQIVKIPVNSIHKLTPPVMVAWQDTFAIIHKYNQKELFIAVPELGLIRRQLKDFGKSWGEEGEILLFQPSKHTPTTRFSLRWFVPELRRYRKVLIEVLIASMVVQIFGLVNPLATQVIIDKVIVNNSPDSLEVFGLFLIVVAIAEAILTAIRTQLFVDTSNRIDLSLGSEVINHLLRLPLSYFERRPVGELATRVGELENIRKFLTGTALTVVMDAVFSILYILVMLVYSWILTIVALATVPLFALINLLVSPIIRRQLQTKAERNAETHSYLVELMGGMQTIKAQNLETRSRYVWQEYYARYISAGFQTISTQTTASSVSGFFNKLSNLLVLWVGAYLVLNQQLTLGQLIAFRILASYVTNPLLRLVQIWQSFQETALSLQRLGDILDTPQETEFASHNILMPSIKGNIKYHQISFGFRENGALQLANINLEIPAGAFVGIVGQSGSGKSTLLKLLPRLYEPKSGTISIDGYDINKVELYSLRRQIGVVLQDTLLFDGTVRENIAIAFPDAGDEEIIAAAKVAYAHDFIMNLPNGYNTQVGERGSGLSGGQRQRIAIARTVLQNPQLLILDEATSALDYNAEAQVCRNLAQVFRGKTVFFITHRLTTINKADKILMMDSGSIVEQGTHPELMAKKGYYYCLYQQQDGQI